MKKRRVLLTVTFLVLASVTAISIWIDSLGKVTSNTHVDSLETDFRSLESALEQYRKTGGTYPSETQGLKALVAIPTDDPLPVRWVKMSERIPTDPWETPILYKISGAKSLAQPEFISAGPDKIFGTSDDLSSSD